MNKYEILKNDSKIINSVKVYRIRRLSDGLVGGYIEKESNLSQDGSCFVYNNAVVHDNAQVYDNAWVYGDASIYDNVMIYANAMVYGSAWVYGDARIYDNAKVFDNAQVYDNAAVFGNSIIHQDVEICTPKCVQNIIGLDWNITVTSRYVRIGCQTILWEDWDEVAVKLGRDNKLDEETISFYKTFIESLLNNIKKSKEKCLIIKDLI